MVSIFALLAGCSAPSDPRQEIEGIVRVDGSVVANGTLFVVPSGDHRGPSATAVVREGRYKFNRNNGPYAGTHIARWIPDPGPNGGEGVGVENFDPKKSHAPSRYETDDDESKTVGKPLETAVDIQDGTLDILIETSEP